MAGYSPLDTDHIVGFSTQPPTSASQTPDSLIVAEIRLMLVPTWVDLREVTRRCGRRLARTESKLSPGATIFAAPHAAFS